VSWGFLRGLFDAALTAPAASGAQEKAARRERDVQEGGTGSIDGGGQRSFNLMRFED